MSYPVFLSFFLSFLASFSWCFRIAFPDGRNSSREQFTGSSKSHSQHLIIMTIQRIINEMYTTQGAMLGGTRPFGYVFWTNFVQTVATFVLFGHVWRLTLLPALMEHATTTQHRPMISSKSLCLMPLMLGFPHYVTSGIVEQFGKPVAKIDAGRLWAWNSLQGTASRMCYSCTCCTSSNPERIFQC